MHSTTSKDICFFLCSLSAYSFGLRSICYFKWWEQTVPIRPLIARFSNEILYHFSDAEKYSSDISFHLTSLLLIELQDDGCRLCIYRQLLPGAMYFTLFNRLWTEKEKNHSWRNGKWKFFLVEFKFFSFSRGKKIMKISKSLLLFGWKRRRKTTLKMRFLLSRGFSVRTSFVGRVGSFDSISTVQSVNWMRRAIWAPADDALDVFRVGWRKWNCTTVFFLLWREKLFFFLSIMIVVLNHFIFHKFKILFFFLWYNFCIARSFAIVWITLSPYAIHIYIYSFVTHSTIEQLSASVCPLQCRHRQRNCLISWFRKESFAKYETEEVKE